MTPGRVYTRSMATRRRFLQSAAAAVAAARFPSSALAADFDPNSWSSVRDQFELDTAETNFATFLLAPHPNPVREAIERHRAALDWDAKRYLDSEESPAEDRVRSAAAAYLEVLADEIALTDSTTMGLALVYGGLRLRPGQEVLTTTHDFYSTHESLRLRALRTGAHVRRVRLYRDAHTVSVDEVVSAVRRAVRPRTRALALTWVHSSTGVKLPVRAIADALRAVNRARPPADRILLCVDAVHGFGVDASAPAQLACDVFVAGCHKWLFGPRGTGLVWANPGAWSAITPTIPSFDGRAIGAWMRGQTPRLPRAAATTPGGFHAFEHRWALREAFEFRQQIGAARVEARTHELADRLKAGLRQIAGIRLVTPDAPALSAGLVCFSVGSRDPGDVVAALYDRARIVASVTPYAARYVRLGPSILNSPEDIDRALRTLRDLT
jgi:selenocysteine lyase/cysteine desulfurase